MPRTLPDRSDLAGAEEWIRSLVTPTGPVEVAHRRRVSAFAHAIAWVRQRDALPVDA